MKSELQVPSDLKFLIVVEQWLLGCLESEVAERTDWTRQSNRLRLVIAESFSNVVRHAHRDRPHLPVALTLKVDDLTMCLELWDRGEGFDMDTYLPPVPSNKQENGYGWLILNRLMDRVEYRPTNDGRNCLKLETNFPEAQSKDREAAPAAN